MLSLTLMNTPAYLHVQRWQRRLNGCMEIELAHVELTVKLLPFVAVCSNVGASVKLSSSNCYLSVLKPQMGNILDRFKCFRCNHYIWRVQISQIVVCVFLFY